MQNREPSFSSLGWSALSLVFFDSRSIDKQSTEIDTPTRSRTILHHCLFVFAELCLTMIDLKKISSILSKALAWNSKPTEQSFPELPEVLVRCQKTFQKPRILRRSSHIRCSKIQNFSMKSSNSSRICRFGSDVSLQSFTALTWVVRVPPRQRFCYKHLTC